MIDLLKGVLITLSFSKVLSGYEEIIIDEFKWL